MNQELLVILKSLFELNRENRMAIHIFIFNPLPVGGIHRKCVDVDCSYCPFGSYHFKPDYLRQTLIQIYTLSLRGFAP